MNRFLSPVSFALALVPAVALAQQPAACERVEFSEEVLARFPNIRSACLDVITKGDNQYAVVKATLVSATPRRMTVRIKRPDGSLSDPVGINVTPSDRVKIDGKPTAIQDIAIGQELTTYIGVTDPGIGFEPVDESTLIDLTAVPATSEPEAAPSDQKE